MGDFLTYPVYENRSGWNQMLEPLPHTQHEHISNHYDYIIVGAGFTGFACAIRLAELEPNKSILIIEATQVGEGSSGRNSGFLLPLHRSSYSGDDQKTILDIYTKGLVWLQDRIKMLEIDCDWSTKPKIDAAATDLGIENLKKQEKEYQRLGINYKVLTKDDIYTKTGTNYYAFGLEVHNNHFIQPAKLIRGYAKNLPNNVTLLQSTPVVRIDTGTVSKVITRNGEISADTIVLTNNGFAKKLGFLQDRLVTIYTYAGMTKSLSDEEFSMHGSDTEWGVIPAHRLGTTLRKIKNNRFMVRSEYSYEKPMTQFKADQILKDCYRRRYPNLKDHSFEFVWGGVTALTHNNESYFGRYQDSNIYIVAGCNGAGGVKGTTHGKLLAEMIVGSTSSDLSWVLQAKKPSYLPPEPFRGIGAQASIQYHRYKAGIEK